MALSWIAPAALIGAGLISLPIAIHLLVRQHARSFAFPSLRFLRETQLAAFRRRTIQDFWLLLCRAAIIAVGAMALAGPLLQTSARTAAYASRVSRAVVALDSDAEDSVVATLGSGTFASTVVRRSNVGDSLTDALRWLEAQPPSAREIVIAGALRRGSITEADLASIPKDVGLRFQAVPVAANADVTWPILARRDGVLVRIDRDVHFAADATRVSEGKITPVRADLISIAAPAADQPLADAALRAALDAGVPWTDFEKKFAITWEVAPSPASSAADVVLATLTQAASRHDQLEPVTIAAEQLNKWSRPPGPPAVNAPKRDEGDRRWMWAIGLLLIALETWMRRGPSQSASQPVADTEVRVA